MEAAAAGPSAPTRRHLVVTGIDRLMPALLGLSPTVLGEAMRRARGDGALDGTRAA